MVMAKIDSCIVAKANSKLKTHVFLGCRGFIWKHMLVSSQYACVIEIDFGKTETVKMCRRPDPKRPQTGMWTHLYMPYLNLTGFLNFAFFLLFLRTTNKQRHYTSEFTTIIWGFFAMNPESEKH